MIVDDNDGIDDDGYDDDGIDDDGIDDDDDDDIEGDGDDGDDGGDEDDDGCCDLAMTTCRDYGFPFVRCVGRNACRWGRRALLQICYTILFVVDVLAPLLVEVLVHPRPSICNLLRSCMVFSSRDGPNPLSPVLPCNLRGI